MAETDFKALIIQALIVGLFIVSMLSFVYTISVNNGANETILNDSDFNNTFTTIQGILENSQGIADNQSLNQDLSNPIAVFDFLSEAIVGTVKVFKGIFSGLYDITFNLIMVEFGIDPIVLYSITAMLLITIIFLGWRTWKRG